MSATPSREAWSTLCEQAWVRGSTPHTSPSQLPQGRDSAITGAQSTPLEEGRVPGGGHLVGAVVEQGRPRSQGLGGLLQQGVHLGGVRVPQVAPLCLQPPARGRVGAGVNTA